MDDAEIVRRCALAMKYKLEGAVWEGGKGLYLRDLTFEGEHYDPLRNGTHAMQLVEKFNLNITLREWRIWEAAAMTGDHFDEIVADAQNRDLKRAICLCVVLVPL